MKCKLVDGDKSLVVADTTIISVAERNIKKYDIVPLFYNMKKALPSQISNEKIYQSLVLAFTSAPIGLFSNNISKVWNSDTMICGTYEEQRHAIDCIKRLCCQSNYCIDYAKTLYKPEFPQQIKKDIQEFTKQLLPHYFIYAKDKTETQVRDNNGTFVNKLHDIIPNPRIRCKYTLPTGKQKALAKPDYKLLMTNPELEIDKDNEVVLTYNKLAALYGYKINAINDKIETGHIPREVLYKSQVRQDVLYGKVIAEVKQDLNECGYSEIEIADILVKYLYDVKDSKNKDLLWACYGEILYNNLKDRVKSPTKEVQCVDCGEWFEIGKFDSATCRCENCLKEHKRELRRLKKQRYRQRIAMSTLPSN